MVQVKTTIYIDDKVLKEIDREAKDQGFSRSTLIKIVLSEHIRESKIMHYNVYEDHITLWDSQMKHLIDVYIRDEKLTCGYCLSEDCEHVKASKKIPVVKNEFEKRGILLR